MIPRKLQHICSGFLGDRTSNQYDSFSGNMVLKSPFFSDTWEASTLQIHWSGLLEDSIESL